VGDSAQLRELRPGNSGARLFRFRNERGSFVLKQLDPSRVGELGWAVALNELRAYRLFERYGCSLVPRLRFARADEGSRQISLVLEDVGESAFTGEPFRFLAALHADLRRLADHDLRGLTRLSFDADPWVWSWRLPPLSIPNFLRPTIMRLDWLLALYQSINRFVEWGPIHNDFALENVAECRGQAKAVDWEDLCIGPVSRDLGTLYHGIYGLDLTRVPGAEAGYLGLESPLLAPRLLVLAVKLEACRRGAQLLPWLVRRQELTRASSLGRTVLLALENIHETESGLW
jgi:hypothetical protein